MRLRSTPLLRMPLLLALPVAITAASFWPDSGPDHTQPRETHYPPPTQTEFVVLDGHAPWLEPIGTLPEGFGEAGKETPVPTGSERYRLSWDRSFHSPVDILLERRGERWILIYEDHPGQVDMTALWMAHRPRRPERSRWIRRIGWRALERHEWEHFQGLMAEAEFWSLPRTLEGIPGCDGATWHLEAATPDRQHVVDRWSPKHDEFRQLGLYLLRLSKQDFEAIY